MQLAPISRPPGGKWVYALEAPLKDHVTNLGQVLTGSSWRDADHVTRSDTITTCWPSQAYLADSGESQCYDNFIVPSG